MGVWWEGVYLQYHPMSFLGTKIHCIFCDNLLTLAERNVVEIFIIRRETQQLSMLFYILQRVHSW